MAIQKRVSLSPEGVGIEQGRISRLVALEDSFGSGPPPVRELPVVSSPYDILLNSIYDAVLITTTDGDIRECNARAVADFGRPSDNLKTMNVLSLIAGADKSLMTYLQGQISAHMHTVLEANCIRGDGSQYPVEIAVTELPKRIPPACCFFIRDITMRKQAEDELQKANTQLVEHEKAVAGYETLCELYHDLNNPLQVLMSLAELNGHTEYQEQLGRVSQILQRVMKARGELAGREEGGGHAVPDEEDWKNADLKRLLLADDEPQICELFGRAIAMHYPDITVDSAVDGRQAIELFRAHHHGIIIMDVNMPVIGGVEAYHAIYQHCTESHWCLPPFIFCTGYDMPTEVAEIIGDGSYHTCVRKPLMLSSLIAIAVDKLKAYGS